MKIQVLTLQHECGKSEWRSLITDENGKETAAGAVRQTQAEMCRDMARMLSELAMVFEQEAHDIVPPPCLRRRA